MAEPIQVFGVIRAVLNRRICWIDVGKTQVFEAWLENISDAGATIIVEGITLPATFIVYFDSSRLVGRTSVIKQHNGTEYRILFTGRAPRPVP
jgi:hypothetical protein